MDTAKKTHDAPRRALYFIPGIARATAEALVACGLADRFDIDPENVQEQDNNRFGQATVQDGPGGVAGVVVGFGQGAGVVYDPRNQAWFDFGGWWFGWANGAQPRPKDLERARLTNGRNLVLGDGCVWTIPVAALQPRSRRLEGGKWVTVPYSGAVLLWDIAERRRGDWDTISGVTESWLAVSREFNELLEANDPTSKPRLEKLNEEIEGLFAARQVSLERLDPNETIEVLKVNYRIGAEETSALGLLIVDPDTGESTDWIILDCLMDGAALRDAKKKGTSPVLE